MLAFSAVLDDQSKLKDFAKDTDVTSDELKKKLNDFEDQVKLIGSESDREKLSTIASKLVILGEDCIYSLPIYF